LLGELAQAAGEDVGSDPAELSLQLPEPPGAGQQGRDDQERPAIADHGQRLVQGRGGQRVGVGLLAAGRLLAFGFAGSRSLGFASCRHGPDDTLFA